MKTPTDKQLIIRIAATFRRRKDSSYLHWGATPTSSLREWACIAMCAHHRSPPLTIDTRYPEGDRYAPPVSYLSYWSAGFQPASDAMKHRIKTTVRLEDSPDRATRSMIYACEDDILNAIIKTYDRTSEQASSLHR